MVTEKPAGSPRRTQAVAAVLLIVAAALLWSAGRMTWVEYTSVDGLRPPVEATLDGGQWEPASTPLALLLVAGIAAMFAARGVLVRVVGALLALAGIAVAAQGFSALFGDPDTGRIVSIAELSAGAEVTAAQILVIPAVLTVLAGLLAIAAAIPLVLGRTGRQGLSSSYETPAARKAAAAESVAAQSAAAKSGAAGEGLEQRQIWDALDAGADPTEDEEYSPDHPETGENRSNS